jgi:hypothetical protein
LFADGAPARRSTSSLGAMRFRVAILLTALGAGVLITIVLTAASYVLFEAGAKNLSAALSWPNSLLQAAAPCVRVQASVVGRSICEGTPFNDIAFVASFPLSIVVYSVIAYGIIRRRSRKGT